MTTETNTINQNGIVNIENNIPEQALINAQKASECTSKILEWLRKFVEIFRKHGIYSTMEEMKECIGEMTYANAETAEILSQLITIMDNTDGKLQGVNVPSEESQKIIDDFQTSLNEQTEKLKAAILKDKSIDEVLNSFVMNNTPYALFGDGHNIYVADIVDGTAGNIIDTVERVNCENNDYYIVLSEAMGVDKSALSLKLQNSMNMHDEAYKDLVKSTLVENVMTNEERSSIETLKEQLNQAKKNALSDERFEMDKARFKTELKDGKFYVGDRVEKVVYVFSNNDNKDIEVNIYRCNSNLEPIGKPLTKMPVAEWKQEVNGTVSSFYNKPVDVDTDTIWKLNTVRNYLSASGLSKEFGEDISPNQINEKLTADGHIYMRAVYDAMMKHNTFADFKKKNYTIKAVNTKGNYYILKSPDDNLTVKINVGSDGKARNVEYDVGDDNKGFIKSHNILNGKTMPSVKDIPLDVQAFVKMCMDASYKVLNRDDYGKDEENEKNVDKYYDENDNNYIYEAKPVEEEKSISTAVKKDNQGDSIMDKSLVARFAAAQQGKDEDLDKLIYDEDERVRAAVAQHGRPQDLKILVNDTSLTVRNAVAEYKEKHPDEYMSVRSDNGAAVTKEEATVVSRETVVLATLKKDIDDTVIQSYIIRNLGEKKITVDELYEKGSAAKLELIEGFLKEHRSDTIMGKIGLAPEFEAFLEKKGISSIELSCVNNKDAVIKVKSAILLDTDLALSGKRDEFMKQIDSIEALDNTRERAIKIVADFDKILAAREKLLQEKVNIHNETSKKSTNSVERE